MCLGRHVTLLEAAALVGVGLAAGIASTVASLASVVSYPALLAFGLPPLSANMTNTVSLLFTAAGAGVGSRPELSGQWPRVWRLSAFTAAGGATGAALLLLTPAQTFERAAPVLIGAASLLLLRPPRLAPPSTAAPAQPRDRHPALLTGVFCVAIYTGYFGAAGGVLMLAVLMPMLAEPLTRTNAVKNVIGGFANGVAAVGFAIFGRVDWAVVGPLAAGFLIGGWTGPALVRRLPAAPLRMAIALAGLAVAVRLGIDAYR